MDELDDVVVTGASGIVPDEAVVAAATGNPPEETAGAGDGDGDDPADRAAAGDTDDHGDDAAGESAEGDGTEDSKDASEAARTLGKKKGSLQKRIDQLRAGEAREKARADALARELAALRSGQPAAQPPVDDKTTPTTAAAEPPAGDPEPNLADYDGEDGKTYEKWVADQAKWAARQALREQAAADRARVERETADRAFKDAVAQHHTRIEAFKATQPDFDTVLNESAAIVTDMMTDFIVRSDVGPALTYHLAQHPEESQQIAAMPVRDALIALGRLEGRLSAHTSTQAARSTGPAAKAPVTRAPLPPKPVGGGSPAATVSDDDLDTDDFIERRNREEAEARRRR